MTFWRDRATPTFSRSTVENQVVSALATDPCGPVIDGHQCQMHSASGIGFTYQFSPDISSGSMGTILCQASHNSFSANSAKALSLPIP
jgi:hypothetical protein